MLKNVELYGCTCHCFLCRRPRTTLRWVCEGDKETLYLHRQTYPYHDNHPGFSSQVQCLSFDILTNAEGGSFSQSPGSMQCWRLTADKRKCSELSANFWSCSVLGRPPEWLGIQFAYPYVQAGKGVGMQESRTVQATFQSAQNFRIFCLWH